MMKMPSFRDLSIKRKLTLITTVTSSIALLLACAAFIKYQLTEMRDGTVAELLILSQVIGTNCTAALAFQDKEFAGVILSGLQADRRILGGWIYAEDGSLFASYLQDSGVDDSAPEIREPGHYFEGDSLLVFQPVRFRERRVGTICLRGDLKHIGLGWRHYAVLITVILGSTLVAFLLSAGWQRSISGPILELTRTARQVSAEKDYALRAVSQSRDELGLLIDDFNEMLAQIQDRDQELERHRNHLEDEVTARTTDLVNLNAELRRSLEKEKELGELKTRFVSMVSHELRTPLTIILSSAELLELCADKLKQEKKDVYFRRIKSAVQHMTNMLTNVLLASKARAGKLKAEPRRLELEVVAANLVATMQPTIGEARIAVKVLGEPRPVWLDPKLLTAVLHNLISNAIKYSPAGSPIEVDLSFAEREVTLVVTDRGMGIPEEDLTHMFEMFHRSANVANLPGTGLGLASVKEFVELEGGRVGIRSKLGSGTSVTVILPAPPIGAEANQPGEVSPQASPETAGNAVASGQDRRPDPDGQPVEGAPLDLNANRRA